MTQTAQYGILRSRSDRMFYPRLMEELTSMLEAGKVKRISGFSSAFEEVEPSVKANAPEDLDSVTDEEGSKVYATKVMTPEKPAAKRPRTQRFRPPAQPKSST